MLGVNLDNIIVSGEQYVFDEFFGQLKQRFPVKNLGEPKMYNGILEKNQTTLFAEHVVDQCNISATSNNPGSPGVDLGPRKDGESGG